MAAFNWSDELTTGNQMIDDDHKHLIELVNTLGEAMSGGKSNSVLRTILNELIAYTASHFEREEKLMQQIGYWAHLPHKADHDALVGEVVALRARFESGALTLSTKVYFFLTEWLNKHIKTSDKLLGAAAHRAAHAATSATGR